MRQFFSFRADEKKNDCVDCVAAVLSVILQMYQNNSGEPECNRNQKIRLFYIENTY